LQKSVLLKEYCLMFLIASFIKFTFKETASFS